ncbi:MAG: YbaB/EbfC family nucleoid-associated protein [Nocardioides sp.]
MTMSRLEAVLATIDAQADTALAKLEQAQQFATRSEHLAVEGKSADEMATVTVDGTGQVQAIAIEDDVQHLTGAQIAADVFEALRQAQRRLSFHVEQLGTEIYGAGSPSVEEFSRAYRDRYGYEEDEES